MRRVLEGMIYDTDKATEVCSVWEGNGKGDFQHIDATLYRTKRSKQFFLAGWGGAMTRFAIKNSDGTYSGSEKIVPLSNEEALHFAEKHASVETMEKFFVLVEA